MNEFRKKNKIANEIIDDLETGDELLLSLDRKRIIARRSPNSSLWDWDGSTLHYEDFETLKSYRRFAQEAWSYEHDMDVMMDDDSPDFDPNVLVF